MGEINFGRCFFFLDSEYNKNIGFTMTCLQKKKVLCGYLKAIGCVNFIQVERVE